MKVRIFFAFSFLLYFGCGSVTLTPRPEADAVLTTFHISTEANARNGEETSREFSKQINDLMTEMRMGVPVTENDNPDLALKVVINSIFNGDKLHSLKFVWYLSDVSSGNIIASETINHWYNNKDTASKILAKISEIDLSSYGRKEARRIAEQPRTRSKSKTDGGQDYAVIVGIEKYRNEIPTALYAENDAKKILNIFKNTLNIPEENIRFLTNDKASKTDIDAALFEWLPKNLTKKSRAFIYFSGQGTSDFETGEPYILPYDADLPYLKTGGVLVSKIQTSLEKSESNSVYLFLDTSFSGHGPRSTIRKGTRPLIPTEKLENTDLVVMYASSAGESASLNPTSRHGLFTHFLLEAMTSKSDENADGDLSLRELFEYIRRRVVKNGNQSTQRPSLNAPISLDPSKVRFIQGIEK